MRLFFATIWWILFVATASSAVAEDLPDANVRDAEELAQAMAEVGPGDRRVIRLTGQDYRIRRGPRPGRLGRGACPVFGRPDRQLAELPEIAGRVTLLGNGAVIRGVEGASLPFCIEDGGKLTLKDLSISRFAKVVLNRGTLRLFNVTVRSNGVIQQQATGNNPLVDNLRGELEITDTLFVENEADIIEAGIAILRNSAFTHNETFQADPIIVARQLDMVNVTVSGNSGGVRTAEGIIEHSTIVNNGGTGVDLSNTMIVRNSIIASNDEADCSAIHGAVKFEGVNLDSDGSCGLDQATDLVAVNPELSALRELDGRLPGHEPQAGSQVLDRADPAFCPLRDAVGRIRDTSADGDDRCALGAVERPNETPDFEIDARLTATWYDPDHDGHYVTVEVLPNDRVAALWWTYDREGNQLWLVGNGTVDGNSARVEVFSSRGMRLPSLDEEQRVEERWGTLELEFEDCQTSKLRWQSDQPGFSDGSANLQRLTSIDGLGCR